jgi:hypothetical protein
VPDGIQASGKSGSELEHTLCWTVTDGIIENSLTGDSRRVLVMPEGATITALTANKRWLSWVGDADAGQLLVDFTRLTRAWRKRVSARPGTVTRLYSWRSSGSP